MGEHSDKRLDSGSDEYCVEWDMFCAAVFVFVLMNEEKRPTIPQVASAFNTDEVEVREAINYYHGGREIEASDDGSLFISSF